MSPKGVLFSLSITPISGWTPHKFTDKYTNYFENNQKMAKINQRYCIENQGGMLVGEDCWGLTASDFAWNYQAQEPMPHRDNGTMAPTGALAFSLIRRTLPWKSLAGIIIVTTAASYGVSTVSGCFQLDCKLGISPFYLWD